MQDIKKIAKLAKLHLSEAEEKKLQQNFKTVIDYINLLQAAPITGQQLSKDESLQKTTAEDKLDAKTVNLKTDHKEGLLFKVPAVIK